MAIITIVLRKMLKNRWLVLCLLFGLIISIALVSSIPMYSSGVLHRMLIKELENYQIETNRFPGAYHASLYFKAETKTQDKYGIFEGMDTYVKEEVPRLLGIPTAILVEDMESEPYTLTPEDPTKVDPTPNRMAKIEALSDFESHVKVVDGKMPAKEKVDGVYEALVTEGALSKLKMVLGNVFVARVPVDGGVIHLKVKPVGVFVPKETDDLYWSRTSSIYDERFYIDMDLFKRDFIHKDQPLVKTYNWYYALDYRAIEVHNIGSILDAQDTITRNTSGKYGGFKVNAPMMEILEKYIEQQKQITVLLLSLNVPVLLLLCFYLFMVSFLIVEADRNEIALLRSRGAARWHIIAQYLIEGLILAGIALLLGPLVGLFLTRFLGTSSGFMEFVNRKALPVSLHWDAYQYGLIGAAVFVVMLLMPAYGASKTTIVGHKQQLARYTGKVWWSRFCIDFVLLGIAGYGYYSFNQHQQILMVTGADATSVQVSPLLFFASTLFALGIGLFFLRIYPLLVEGVYRLGSRWWSPPLYETLTHVGRSSRQYQFLMTFLVMTIAIGLFSANAARTLNRNMEERILYQVGSDIVIKPVWQGEYIAPAAVDTGAGQQSSSDLPSGSIQYKEPPYLSFEQLPGVEHAAKVYIREGTHLRAGENFTDSVQLMAIDPYDFGSTAWFRGDLMAPYHINAYLNLIAQEPSAVLISQSISTEYKVKVGDYISLGWPGVDDASFIVYGVIDYWPSWNPLGTPESGRRQERPPMLVVANLPYVQNNLAMEPYQIWLKLKPDATSTELYEGIEEKDLRIDEIQDANQEIIKVRTNPSQMGMNGAMTLGFIISLAITFLGFLLYWVLAMKGRIYEFGVLRAMGISLPQLIGMMVWEQLLTSGVAIMSGIAVGGITSKIFVPFLQVAYNASNQVPPFRVISEGDDRVKLYVMLGIMIFIGLLILGNILTRIKINQAIKLGED
jgi:putative ABC transport system permease protein